jgi:hypothetical protein
MHSPDGCIPDFLNAMDGKSPFEVHAAAEAEKREALRRSEDPGVYRAGMLYYVEQLRALQYFIVNGSRPRGLSDEEFRLFQTLAAAWVERGQVSPSVLEAFNGK